MRLPVTTWEWTSRRVALWGAAITLETTVVNKQTKKKTKNKTQLNLSRKLVRSPYLSRAYGTCRRFG